MQQMLLSVEDVSKILNIGQESVRRYIRTGELKSTALGSRILRISQEDLNSFIEEKKLSVQVAVNVGGVKPGSIWHSPLNVYWHLQKEAEKVGTEKLENDGKYQDRREARIAAVMALILFRLTNKPAFIQLYRPDPPDALIMQRSVEVKGQQDITQLEITRYLGNSHESLLDQLKRNKVPPGVHKYSENYILVVNIYKNVEVNFEEVNTYLLENKTPFPVWCIRELEAHPDTICEVTVVNPFVEKRTVNLGESAHVYDKLQLPGIIRTRRVGKTDLVRIEKAEKSYLAPWETLRK